MHTIADITPKENAWFCPNVRYEGKGRAEFANNRGAAEGDVTALFDEYGGHSIRMQVEKTASTPDVESRLWELSATESIVEQGATILSYGPGNNPCMGLTVRTAEGTFRSIGVIDYDLEIANEGGWIDFHPLRSQFDKDGAGTAKYWVLPLFNFVSGFSQCGSVGDHPLRIFPTPAIPTALSQQDFFKASILANSRNNTIPFTFNGSPGFIEPLPDYQDREKKLKDLLTRSVVTAVMVGEVGGNSIEPESIKDWFPFGLLRVLGFATGTKVGAPWIEFRDSAGNLVRRIHESYETSIFVEGHRTIHEFLHRGTGRLMTCYLTSKHCGKGYIDVAMSHAINGWKYSHSTIEEKLIYVVRGLDCLCGQFGFRQQDLVKRLGQGNKQAVREVLEDAAAKITALAGNSGAVLGEDEKRALIKISERLASTPRGTTRDFGLALTDLLNKFAFPDASILDAHYAHKTAGSGKASKWTSMLSHFRGAPIHGGFFDFDSGEFKIDDILAVTRHLHDILVRVILKMVGYDGEYQHTVIQATTRCRVDWVQPTMSARDLGYD